VTKDCSSHTCRRIVSVETCSERRHGIRGYQIGFSDNDLISQCYLFTGHRVAVEMQWPVHGIDGGDHAFNAKVMLEHGIRYHRNHQRGGVGQPRRFDPDTPEGGYDAPLIATQQRSEGLHQLLPHRAADAAMTQEDGLLIKALDQMVIEPHLAKLVDQYG